MNPADLPRDNDALSREAAAGATVPWRIEDRENGTRRLIVRFNNIEAAAGSRIASVVAGIFTALTFLLVLLPIIDRWWAWAGLLGIAAFLFAVWLRQRFGIVDTVVELPAGLVFHRYRSRMLAKVAHHRVAEYGLVLSHPFGESQGIGVYLSGRDGEFEIARFGPAQEGTQPWLFDHPQAEALRRCLARTLNLRLMGVV